MQKPLHKDGLLEGSAAGWPGRGTASTASSPPRQQVEPEEVQTIFSFHPLTSVKKMKEEEKFHSGKLNGIGDL